MDNRETLKALVELAKALNEQLNDGDGAYPEKYRDVAYKAMDCLPALEALLNQKPVAHVRKVDGITSVHGEELLSLPDGASLFASPSATVPVSELEALINEHGHIEDGKALRSLIDRSHK